MTVTPAAHTPEADACAWTTSADFDQLAPAFVAALGELEDVAANRKADAGKFSYSYADLADVLTVARPVLARHGLAVFQVPVTIRGAVEVTTTVLHASGQWLRFAPLRLPAGDSAQAIGSAITYGRRYSESAALNVAAVADDDGARAGDVQAKTDDDATDEVLMPQAWLDKFHDRTFPLSAAEVAAVVRTATRGRTDDPELVWYSEAEALGQALSVALGEDLAAASSGPPAVDAAATDSEDDRSRV